METCFASPQRATPHELSRMVNSVNDNRIISSLLGIVDGCLAVLNEHRQILALNHTLLNMLGIDDPEKALGLRPGEAVNCIHARGKPHGCGTTEFCSTCGAAIAMVTSLSKKSPAEGTCAITVNNDTGQKELFFRVRSQPLSIGRQNYLLLFLQDISLQQQWAVIERIFFHDLNNTINGLLNASELLNEQQPENSLISIVQKLAAQLSSEVLIQQYLKKYGVSNFKPALEEISAEVIMHEIQKAFTGTQAGMTMNLVFQSTIPPVTLKTNLALVCRVLTNMITNALEASSEGETVKVSVEAQSRSIRFCVWNRQVIPEDISKRIFQRNFSTKNTMGRGWGTYSMKLIGENILKGSVDFTSAEPEGTTFCFSLPLTPTDMPISDKQPHL